MTNKNIIALLITLSFNVSLYAVQCSGPAKPPTVAPVQASTYGFKNLVFDDEFNSVATISPNNKGNYYWYTWNVYGPTKYLTLKDISVTNGCLTIFTDLTGSGADLQTVNSATDIAGTFQHGYIEARIQFNPNDSYVGRTSWPAFWLEDLKSISQVSPFAELDVMEAPPAYPTGVTLITTVHQWTRINGQWVAASDVHNKPNIPTISTNFDYSAFHIYGCLWIPGWVGWYLDNQLVMIVQTGPGTPFTALDQDRMFVIFGTGQNWSTTIDWIHLWQ